MQFVCLSRVSARVYWFHRRCHFDHPQLYGLGYIKGPECFFEGCYFRKQATIFSKKTWPYPIVAGIATHCLNPIAYQLACRLENASLRKYLAPDILVIYVKP